MYTLDDIGTTTFGDYVSAARKGGDFGYFGDEEQFDWIVLPIGQHRDSCCLERSNFESQNALFPDHDIHNWGHWAVGWTETAIIPDTESNRDKLYELVAAYQDYPCVDESHYSEMEWNEASEYWNTQFSDIMNECENKIPELRGDIDYCSIQYTVAFEQLVMEYATGSGEILDEGGAYFNIDEDDTVFYALSILKKCCGFVMDNELKIVAV